MLIRRVLFLVGCLVAVTQVSASPAHAHARPAHRHKPVLVRVEVHTHYTEPSPGVGGVECSGLAPVPPQPDCGIHFVGTSKFTGTMYGDVRYDNYGMWQPNGHLAYRGPDYIDGGVEGCGTGTFVIDDSEGDIDYTAYDPKTNSAPGTNKWHLRRGSGTGGLTNLVDGEGTNTWREDFDGETGQSDIAGEGDFTGWITCCR
jgi:hypothetical protein